MKYAILLMPFLLTACLTVPVKQSFPDVPSELRIACPDLKSVPDNETQLSKVIDVVLQNYAQYEQCRVKVDAWIEWHKQQKEISESVK